MKSFSSLKSMIQFQPALDLPAGHPQAQAAHEDVLAPGVLQVKAGAQLQNGRNLAVNRHISLGFIQHPRQDLQQGALARAVPADDADHFAEFHLKGDIPQGPVPPVGGAPQHHLLHQVHGLGINPEHLGQAGNVNGEILVAHRTLPK